MSDTVIRLKIVLERTEPAIWRRVEVPAAMTLDELHNVIQIAMGWANDHLFDFLLGRESLIESEMVGFGQFRARPGSGGDLRIGDLAARAVKRLTYLYDFGDSWNHTIRIEKRLPAEPNTTYPRLIDGAGRCPPEDCGGIPGFYDFLDAISDPKHPDHHDRLDWYGDRFDPDDFDAEFVDRELALLAAPRKRGTGRRAR